MAFRKGQSGNPKGRKKGTPNILTSELKNLINQIISKELELIPDALEKMTPEKRTEFTIKLLAYVLPKPEKHVKIQNTEVPSAIFLNVSKEYDIDEGGNSIKKLDL